MGMGPYISCAVLLACVCNLAFCNPGAVGTKSTGSKETSTGQHNNQTTQATKHTTMTPDVKQGIMDIPVFDFSKINTGKSGLSAIPTLDFSKASKPKPPKSCSTNMCELMNGICNNGTCIPQDCQSEIVCKCFPGYAGAFCDRNITLVDKAKEVPMLNGKIVSTESPKGNGKNAANDSGGLIGHGKTSGNRTNGNGTNTGIPGGVDPVQVGKDKYKQPNGTFIKGPEVPTPAVSNPINVNVKNQRVKDKSTTIIQTFTNTVTIATVSMNLEQSLTGDASGQTMKKGQGILADKKQTANNTSNKKKQSNNRATVQTNTGKSKASSTGITHDKKKKSQAKSTTAKQNSKLKNAKNVDQVVLSQGKVPIVDKKIKPIGWPTKNTGKK